MSRKRVVLGELEVAVLGVLWDLGHGTVAEIVEALPLERTRHYNTISTVLTRLEKRDLVSGEKAGRALVYRALVDREQLGREYLELLRDDLFGGSVRGMVAALLGGERPRPKQIAEVRAILREMEGEEPRP